MSEIAQLAQSNQSCQLKGPLMLRLSNATPVARPLRIELLKRNERMPPL